MHSHSEHNHSTDTQNNCGCGHTHAKKQVGCSSSAATSTCTDSASSVSEHSHITGSCCSQSHSEEGDDESDILTAAMPAGSQRFSWQVKGMDCPSCARKIENAISSQIDIENVKVLFATEKLVVDARMDIRLQVQQAVKQAGFSLVDTQSPTENKVAAAESRLREYLPIALLNLLMLISWGISFYSTEWAEMAFAATTLVGLIPIASKAWKLIRTGTPFAIETLMSVAAIGALFIGATAEAAMVLLLFMIGELLESYAANRARRGVKALMALVPEEALLLKNGERMRVPVASFDESALTGESIPVERLQGEKVAAGCLSVDRATEMRVISEPGNNAIDRIL